MPRPPAPSSYDDSGKGRPKKESLFIDSTISKDGTAGDLSEMRDMLLEFSGKTEKEPARRLSTSSSGSSSIIVHDSGDELDAPQDRGESRWPREQAQEQAHWRRKVMAERRLLHEVDVGSKTDSRQDSSFEETSLVPGFGLAGNFQRSSLSDEYQQQSRHKADTVSSPGNEVQDTGSASSSGPILTPDLGNGLKRIYPAQPSQQASRALGDPQPTMSESLSAITETFLNIDVLDQKQDISRFIAYLLDTIELLDNRTKFLEARNAHCVPERLRGSAGDESPASESLPPGQRGINTTVGKLLHQVLCSNRSHQHDRLFYEDVPTYRDQHWKGEAKLMGDQVVHTLNNYLSQRPAICFFIIKEYNCTPDVNRIYNRRGYNIRSSAVQRPETIRIVSPLLRKALVRVAEYQPFEGHWDEDFEMRAPYIFLFHHHDKLVELAQDATYQSVLRPLLEFLTFNYGNEYEEAKALFEEGIVTGNHLCKLFKPNQIVIGRQESGHLEAHVLSEDIAFEGDKIYLEGWSWEYDGNVLSRREWDQDIDVVPDERMRIADLKVHPLEYARAEDIKNLEERGRKYWSMKNQTCICYSGWDASQDHQYIEERFMVDMKTYEFMHEKDLDVYVEEHSRLDPWPLTISKTKDLSDKDFMLLPNAIFGFKFKAKKWINLLVDNIHSITWNKNAFSRLVLDKTAKNMIYALVDVQKSAGKMDDIIAGKGNGLIILLHGSPGTGKTLTAESVAELVEKPLYRVTCGDIGTEPREVEKYLETVLYLGKIWDCVLLLDEADVFLEERTMADLQRNSLVSIFLRTLEYYEGILILTSNRVGTFDEAFKSRIQVAIHYDNLTKKSRKAIWSNFFDMIEESEDEDANMAELERRLDELASHEMNGRQIRNAVLTARQLAKHERERLDWKHLSQVMKTSADFNKYLTTVKGHSDDQWAREEMLR